MKKKNSSISEQILALSNPTPVDGPDDFWDEDTTAKVADFDESDDDVANLSSLRKKTAHQILDEDVRYKGSKTSRKSWMSSDPQQDDDEGDDDHDDDEDEVDDEDSYDDEEDDEEDEEEGEIMTKKIKEMRRKMTGRLADIGNESVDHAEDDAEGESFDANDDVDDDEDDDEESLEEYGDGDDDDEEDDLAEEEDEGFEGLTRIDASEEIKKGKAVQSQLGLWDSFMEARIKLQKVLHLSNQLPQCQTLERFLDEGEEEELPVAQKKGEKELTRLLQSLINLQDVLLEQNPETRCINKDETPGAQSSCSDTLDDDDEEIPSDTDDEGENTTSTIKPAPDVKNASGKRKVDPEDFGEHLSKQHKRFEAFRNSTIQKWYEKTRLSTGKMNKKSFSSFERSALLQIQQILQDQNRLIQRTQLKRSEFTILGQRSQVERRDERDEDGQDIPDTANQHLKNYDPEIFDDDDFYHQLLRELIEKRTSSTTDPIQLTRQWLQVQKLRTKAKRQVDTKASKGRKLRYDVHEKLVSFMAPDDSSTMLPEARMELFKSIFGQSNKEEETR